MAAMSYRYQQIDGVEHAELLIWMNSLEPKFPKLQSRHLANGLWWIAQISDGTAIGFAGLVAFTPFENVGYLKRGYVLPDHRGNGIQLEFLRLREEMARYLGLTMLITDCAPDNIASQTNLERAGYSEFNPEQEWEKPGSVYYRKRLS